MGLDRRVELESSALHRFSFSSGSLGKHGAGWSFFSHVRLDSIGARDSVEEDESPCQARGPEMVPSIGSFDSMSVMMAMQAMVLSSQVQRARGDGGIQLLPPPAPAKELVARNVQPSTQPARFGISRSPLSRPSCVGLFCRTDLFMESILSLQPLLQQRRPQSTRLGSEWLHPSLVEWRCLRRQDQLRLRPLVRVKDARLVMRLVAMLQRRTLRGMRTTARMRSPIFLEASLDRLRDAGEGAAKSCSGNSGRDEV